MNGYDSPLPEFLQPLVEKGVVAHGGISFVKTPARLRGLETLTIGLARRTDADLVERLVDLYGWTPRSYRQWDDGPSGSISFVRAEDVGVWIDAGFRVPARCKSF